MAAASDAAAAAAAAVAGRDAVRFFQLYVTRQQDINRQLVQRAEKAGYAAIIITADTPYLGKRREGCRNKLQLPQSLRCVRFDFKRCCNIRTMYTRRRLRPTQLFVLLRHIEFQRDDWVYLWQECFNLTSATDWRCYEIMRQTFRRG